MSGSTEMEGLLAGSLDIQKVVSGKVLNAGLKVDGARVDCLSLGFELEKPESENLDGGKNLDWNLGDWRRPSLFLFLKLSLSG